MADPRDTMSTQDKNEQGYMEQERYMESLTQCPCGNIKPESEDVCEACSEAE